MAGFPGRDIALLWNSAVVPGVREKGISLNGEAINVTSDENSGKRTLLEVSAEDSVDISLSGVTKSPTLRNDWFAGTRTRTVTVTYPDGSVISGLFYLASYQETGPYNDATTFTATLQSAGNFAYTPAA